MYLRQDRTKLQCYILKVQLPPSKHTQRNVSKPAGRLSNVYGGLPTQERRICVVNFSTQSFILPGDELPLKESGGRDGGVWGEGRRSLGEGTEESGEKGIEGSAERDGRRGM